MKSKTSINPLFTFLEGLCALLMVGVSVYMSYHYFSTHFSMGLEGHGSFCSINDFWSCDKATNSPLATLFNVPISVYGLVLSFLFFIGPLAGKKSINDTNALLSAINSLGCLFLLFYSLFALGGLCPMCSVYYLLSFLLFFLHFKQKRSFMKIHPVTLLSYGAIMILVSMGVRYKVMAEQEKMDGLSKKIVENYDRLRRIGDPKSDDALFIHPPKKSFAESTIRLSVFSDFQCPACHIFSEMVPEILKKYKEHIAIQYFSYPLDANCNIAIKQQMHPYACKASYVAICSKDKFAKVHDELFENQMQFSESYFNTFMKEHNIDKTCVESDETKNHVQRTIALGDSYGLDATPTIILNGVKLNLPPVNFLYFIFDELIRRAQMK